MSRRAIARGQGRRPDGLRGSGTTSSRLESCEDQSLGTGTSLTGVIVLVQRVKPGQRNLWRAFTSVASTMKKSVCCAFAPYRPISLIPGTLGLNRLFEPPSSLGQVSAVWTCVMWNSIDSPVLLRGLKFARKRLIKAHATRISL